MTSITKPTDAEVADMERAIYRTGFTQNQAERAAKAVFHAGFRDPDEAAPNIKAEALREAARELRREATSKPGSISEVSSRFYAAWLLDRADKIEGYKS